VRPGPNRSRCTPARAGTVIRRRRVVSA
jgi:hypothetical protein